MINSSSLRANGLGSKTARASVAAPFTAARRAPAVAQTRRTVVVSAATAKYTLYDMPVSNHGARVRHVIYAKGLEDEFAIVPPSELGGLGSPEYKKLSPQGKMPLLVLPDGVGGGGGAALPESEVIVQYICDRFGDRGPSMRAATPELRARAALATRIHDIYVASVQVSALMCVSMCVRLRVVSRN